MVLQKQKRKKGAPEASQQQELPAALVPAGEEWHEAKPPEVVAQPLVAQPPTQRAIPLSELPSSIGPILDKTPLTHCIKEALALVDRVDKQQLCDQLGAASREFSAALTELIEA